MHTSTTGRDIAQALRAAYLHMHRQTQTVLGQFEMTAEQFVLLRVLSLEEGLTQQELTHQASSDPNTVRAMLLILERKGMVVRKRHRTDRRAWQVFLTARSRKLYPKMSAALAPLQAAIVSPFGPAAAESFVAGLWAVVDALQRWEHQPEIRSEDSRPSP